LLSVFGIGRGLRYVNVFPIWKTNWSNFSYATANFLGPVIKLRSNHCLLLSKAAFLGVPIYLGEQSPQGVHFIRRNNGAAAGTFISSFWIYYQQTRLCKRLKV